MHKGVYTSLFLIAPKLITQMSINREMDKINCGTFIQWINEAYQTFQFQLFISKMNL